MHRCVLNGEIIRLYVGEKLENYPIGFDQKSDRRRPGTEYVFIVTEFGKVVLGIFVTKQRHIVIGQYARTVPVNAA